MVFHSAVPSPKPYFASVAPEEIGQRVAEKLQQTAGMESAARAEKLRLAYAHHYGFDFGAGSTSAVQRDGEAGQLARIRVNHSRANLKALVGLVLGPKITWRPKAKNSSALSRSAASLASNLLEELWSERGMSATVRQWTEAAALLGEAFVTALWDETEGPETAGPTGPVRLGDISLRVVMPWEVRRDPTFRRWKDCPWVCVEDVVSRWELLAKTPKDIYGRDVDGVLSTAGIAGGGYRWGGIEASEDTVPVYHLFHRPTLAVPQGRHVVLNSANCVLADGPLRYDAMPVFRLAADEQFATPYGYSSHWDALGVQEELDGLESAIATNQLAGATNTIFLEEGSKVSSTDLRGMRVVYIRPGASPPQSISLANTPKEVFTHADRLAAAQRNLVGLNDVAMGQPQTAQMNADAFAILKSAAVERNSPFQQAVQDAVAQLGTHVLRTYSRRVTDARWVQVAGKGARQAYMRASWTGADLLPVDGAGVEIGSLAETSTAGRLNILQLMAQLGVKVAPEQFQQVVETGRLEPGLEPARDAELYLKHENELLAEGEAPTVSYLDDHIRHVTAHKSVLDNPEARGNPAAVQAVHSHIDEHYLQFWGLPPGSVPQDDPEFPTRIRVLLNQPVPPLAPVDAPPQGPPPGAPEAQQIGPTPQEALSPPTNGPMPQGDA